MQDACRPNSDGESSLNRKEIQPVSPKGNQLWVFIRRTDAEAPILWPPDVKSSLIGEKKPWCWASLRAGGKGSDRGWDGCMASVTQCTGVWANSWRQWRIGKTGILQFLESQSQTWLSDWTTTNNSDWVVLHIKLRANKLLTLRVKYKWSNRLHRLQDRTGFFFSFSHDRMTERCSDAMKPWKV